MGEAPCWLTTIQESSPERLLGVVTGCDHPNRPQRTTRATSIPHGIRTLDVLSARRELRPLHLYQFRNRLSGLRLCGPAMCAPAPAWAFTRYCHYQYCMVYGKQKGGRGESRILPNNRAILLRQGGKCRRAGGMNGWLIRAQQTRRKTTSCKGQSATVRLRLLCLCSVLWPLHDIVITNTVLCMPNIRGVVGGRIMCKRRGGGYPVHRYLYLHLYLYLSIFISREKYIWTTCISRAIMAC